MHPTDSHHRSPSRARVRVSMFVAGLGLLAAGTAQAGPPTPWELHREVREHVGDVLRDLGRVPREIHRQHERNLDAFLGGRSYYGPHRHEHVVYNFPVWTNDDVVYRPYTYCDGQLFGSYSDRPQLWIEWGPDRDGSWCDRCRGYYPHRHGHFRNEHHRDRRDWNRHDRDRYDRDRYDRYDRGHRDHRDRGHRDRDRRGHDRRGHDRRGHGNHGHHGHHSGSCNGHH